MTNSQNPPKTTNKKPILIAVAAVAAIALVIAGVFVYRAVADGNIKSAYSAAVTQLVEEGNQLSQTTALLADIAPEDEDVKAVSARTTELLEEAVSTGAVIPTETELGQASIIEMTAITSQFSDAQSGEVNTIQTMVDEVQLSSGESDTAQSGDTSQSGTTTTMVDGIAVNIDALPSVEQTAVIEQLATRMTELRQVVVDMAPQVIQMAYRELADTDRLAYEAARKTFDDKVASAKILIADSADNVSDNHARDALTAALEKAEKANPALAGDALPSQLRKATESLVESTKSLETGAKTVNDAMVAKKAADKKNAAERATAEQSTVQNTDGSSYGEEDDNGYTNNNGGGGYTPSNNDSTGFTQGGSCTTNVGAAGFYGQDGTCLPNDLSFCWTDGPDGTRVQVACDW